MKEVEMKPEAPICGASIAPPIGPRHTEAVNSARQRAQVLFAFIGAGRFSIGS